MEQKINVAELIESTNAKICVVGLGYVGLPLAMAFGSHFRTVGYDVSGWRIEELKRGDDSTRESSKKDIEGAAGLSFTCNHGDIARCDIYVVAVPTPVSGGIPDVKHLKTASQAIGESMKKGSLVIYESTVYPGCTEEVCIPELERASGLKVNEDFLVGYSPERINPGDKVHALSNIIKVVSGSCPEACKAVDALYRWVIKAGICPVSSMRVAEAVKSVENAQRDVNIAFANEVSVVLRRQGIDSQEVLNAASTKWNFLNFRPGLVGGYCVPNASYYLTYKAIGDGYRPEVMKASRKTNEGMAKHVACEVVKLMIDDGIQVKGAIVRVFGCTFKEGCPETRCSPVFDIVEELKRFHCNVQVVDPHADAGFVEANYGIKLTPFDTTEPKDAIDLYDGGCYKDGVAAAIIAVAHDEFKHLDFGKSTIVYDVKGVLPKEKVNGRL